MGSKGNVKQFFWHAFCLAWPRILLVFECFGGAWQRHLLQRFSTLFGAGDSIAFHAFRRQREAVFWRAYCVACAPKELLFFMDSKGNVKQFFWHAFCLAWLRILLVFECFGGAWQRHLLQRFSTVFGAGDSIAFHAFRRQREAVFWRAYCVACAPKELLFFMDSKGNVKQFFWHAFCLAWPRILLGFECFEGAWQRHLLQ